MKILLISHKHPPSLGGMETQSFYIAQGLRKKHELVEIILKGQESRWRFYFKLKQRVKAALQDHPDIDLIHLNDGLMGFLLHWLPSFTNKPICLTLHGLDLVFPSQFFLKRLLEYNQPHCSIIAVSDATALAANRLGFDEANLVVIFNGVNHDLLSKSSHLPVEGLYQKYGLVGPAKFTLLSVGRAVPRKGLSWYVDKVMTQLPEDIHYLIISPNNVGPVLQFLLGLVPQSWARFTATLMGWTTDYHRLQQIIKKRNLSNRVKVLDKVAFADLIAFYQNTQLFVMPNIKYEGDMEGFGLVLLEANVCGKYAIASNIEGITSAIINGKNGTLVEPHDHQAWTHTITQIYKDNNTELLGLQAAEVAKTNYDWHKMVAAYEEYFMKVSG